MLHASCCRTHSRSCREANSAGILESLPPFGKEEQGGVGPERGKESHPQPSWQGKGTGEQRSPLKGQRDPGHGKDLLEARLLRLFCRGDEKEPLSGRWNWKPALYTGQGRRGGGRFAMNRSHWNLGLYKSGHLLHFFQTPKDVGRANQTEVGPWPSPPLRPTVQAEQGNSG